MDRKLTDTEYRLYRAVSWTTMAPAVSISDYKGEHVYSDFGFDKTDRLKFYIDKTLKRLEKDKERDAELAKIVKDYETKIEEYKNKQDNEHH